MRSLILSVISMSFLASHAVAADPFADKQWGLNNQGVPQMIDLDPLHTYKNSCSCAGRRAFAFPGKSEK
ncbi:hypothetical protein [Bdellovibrio bacteriovorus]|uniref:hypothetical protein n=1 Tax=Bdellovibrio bacteriovorus TaxID=959 RepID=UPI0035A687A8